MNAVAETTATVASTSLAVVSEAVSLAHQTVALMLTLLPALNISKTSSTRSIQSHAVTRHPPATSATTEMTVASTLSQLRAASPSTSLTTKTATTTEQVANRPTDALTKSNPFSSKTTMAAQSMFPASAMAVAADIVYN